MVCKVRINFASAVLLWTVEAYLLHFHIIYIFFWICYNQWQKNFKRSQWKGG